MFFACLYAIHHTWSRNITQQNILKILKWDIYPSVHHPSSSSHPGQGCEGTSLSREVKTSHSRQPPSAYLRKHLQIPWPAERYDLAHCYEPFSPCTTVVNGWSELLSSILLTVCVDRISRHSHAVGRPPPLWPRDFISTFCGWCNSVGGLQLSLDRFAADCGWNEKYHRQIWGHDTQPGKGGVPNWSEEEV